MKLPGTEAASPEIAYDMDFQPLTQFNRRFKHVFGQPPSDFRARLSSRKRTDKAA